MASPVSSNGADGVGAWEFADRDRVPVYLQLAFPWTDDETTMRSVDATIRTWLAKTRRVNGVLVMTERTFRRGTTCVSRLRGSFYVPNNNAHHAVPQL